MWVCLGTQRSRSILGLGHRPPPRTECSLHDCNLCPTSLPLTLKAKRRRSKKPADLRFSEKHTGFSFLASKGLSGFRVRTTVSSTKRLSCSRDSVRPLNTILEKWWQICTFRKPPVSDDWLALDVVQDPGCCWSPVPVPAGPGCPGWGFLLDWILGTWLNTYPTVWILHQKKKKERKKEKPSLDLRNRS